MPRNTERYPVTNPPGLNPDRQPPSMEESGCKEPVFKAETWGKATCTEWLRLAWKDPVIHGPHVIKRLETFTRNLPPEYQSWSLVDKISFLRKNGDTIFDFQGIAEASKEPILDLVNLRRDDLKEVLRPDFEVFPSRSGLRKALQIGIDVEESSLVLFGDGAEIIFVKVEDKEYILRLIKSALKKSEIEHTFDGVPDFVPITKVFAIATEDDCEVVTLTERLSTNEAIAPDDIIGITERIAHELGFVPDIHSDNFGRSGDEKIKYLDADLLEHLLQTTNRRLSVEDSVKLREEIALYRAGLKTIKIRS